MIVFYTFNIGRVATVYWEFSAGVFLVIESKSITELKIICHEEPSVSL